MMKLVTIYHRVDDEAILEDFFSHTHLPLAEQLPGLVKTEVGRVTDKPGGQSRFHLMYELYFTSREEYRQAMLSDVGRQLLEALEPWTAQQIITWFHAETFEEEAV